MIKYSLVVPVYGNSENIPDLLDALRAFDARFPGEFEAVLVVDASPDDCWAQLERALPVEGYSYQLLLHARNFGSFQAIRTGMESARGEFVAVMAADLQEPPDLVMRFYDVLEQGDVDIVFGRREGREDGRLSCLASNLFWKAYSKLVVGDIPEGGVDVFGCNRQVRDSILSIREANSSLVGQCFWVGYRRSFISYVRRKREKGESQWDLRRRMQYAFDSFISFSDLPLRLFVWMGLLGLLVSSVLGGVTLAAKLMGVINIPGYTMIVLFLCFGFAVMVFTQGIIGCYLWRCFENTKNRPLSIVSRHVSRDADGGADE